MNRKLASAISEGLNTQATVKTLYAIVAMLSPAECRVVKYTRDQDKAEKEARKLANLYRIEHQVRPSHNERITLYVATPNN